ncbi:TrkH family potassium uptake protein [Rhodobacter sp. HX-7-19]|uniref:Trk system potassium uptake protein n=1 Tax=Paragemmobacter kunshanensis TaxID=2583234 RepID=A0A6M1U7R0_9RHOB|nr:TrkH family potassium uptake protein [Rhodobacter kunshanensis]NGQ89971.1 TrkH family potassium uptake protein [Rhodobacter kunshanensis]
MLDFRPISYVFGRILIVLAILMVAPAIVDWSAGDSNAWAFVVSALVTGGGGGLVALATVNRAVGAFDIRQAYLLTAAIWFGLPVFAALPFMLGVPHLNFTEAYFEAVSGLTTTGATVIYGLDEMPAGMNLWRGLLNGAGGLGIAFVAMIFLPVMRVGGMQFFRTEGFDTFGKALPRATDIARDLLGVYVGLILIAGVTFAAIGMTALDATVHAIAAIATGGFSPRDASFNPYSGAGEYFGALFMLLGSLPYIRYVQLVRGTPRALWRDGQVRAYLKILAVAVGSVTLWRWLTSDMDLETVFRESLFNLTSIISSTGFFSGSFSLWGGFMLPVAFVIGMMGACSGSSAAGLSVFRVQLIWAALVQQIRLIVMPGRVVPVKYDGRTVEPDVMDALILYVGGFILTLGVLTVAMTLTGVDAMSSLFAVWTCLGNIGYGFGPLVERTGTFVDFPDIAKWVMTLAMISGRLGLLAIFVLVLPRFWQR